MTRRFFAMSSALFSIIGCSKGGDVSDPGGVSLISIDPTGDLRRDASKFVDGRYGRCLRCDASWARVAPHITDYSNGSAGFPLCKACWRDLGTWQARLPFYLVLRERQNFSIASYRVAHPGEVFHDATPAQIEQGLKAEAA